MVKKILSALTVILFSQYIHADDSDTKVEVKEKPIQQKVRNAKEFQDIIKEYRESVANTPKEVRDEIIEYRRSIAKLNKEKIDLYNKLTNASQNYLKQEQDYKNRLPLNRKQLMESKPKE